MTRVFATIGVVFATIGCGQKPEPRQDLRPFVAVTGFYSVQAAAAPKPAPVVKCTEGCKCKGTGKEPTGGGETVAACRCPESCPCKKAKP
jgi:hypothetical protein